MPDVSTDGTTAHKHFACLRHAPRTWVVAAVHGDAGRLATLHGHLAERLRADDNLVYLGNVLGQGGSAKSGGAKGGGVGETVEELLIFRRAFLSRPRAHQDDIVFLRGGQEEMWHKLLQIQLAPNPSEVVAWMLDNGVGATIEAYGGTADEALSASRSGAMAMTTWTNRLRAAMRDKDGHNAFMSALRRAAYTTPDGGTHGGLLFVHTGIDVSRPLSEQKDSFWWGSPGFDDLREPYGGFTRVVRGYSPRHPGLLVNAATTTVDGGCGFGGPLIAACFDDGGAVIDQLEV